MERHWSGRLEGADLLDRAQLDRVHVGVWGVILFDPLGTTVEMWDPLVEAASEGHCRISDDKRGHAGSPVTVRHSSHLGLSYAFAGNGTSIHLADEVFAAMAQLKLLHIPYKGSGPAVTDLPGGQVDLMFDSITSARRSSALPDVPTLAVAGVPGYEASPWFGVFAPAGTPADVVARLNKALTTTLRQPEIVRKLESVGAEPMGSTPQALAEHLNKELLRWGALIQERGIRLD